MLLKRFITAAVALPLLFALIWFVPESVFSLAVAFVIACAAFELSILMGCRRRLLQLAYVLVVLTAFCLIPMTAMIPVLCCALFFWLLAGAAVVRYGVCGRPGLFSLPPVIAVFGLTVLLAFAMGLVFMRAHGAYFEKVRLLFLLAVVFSADMGGYFVGRFWGKRLLLPKVSPKKTWLGVLGALLAGLLCAAGFAWAFRVPESGWLILAAVTGGIVLISILGDLTISLLKRSVGMKDTGSLFPGHGGLLDRLDSVLPSVHVFAFLLVWMGF